MLSFTKIDQNINTQKKILLTFSEISVSYFACQGEDNFEQTGQLIINK